MDDPASLAVAVTCLAMAIGCGALARWGRRGRPVPPGLGKWPLWNGTPERDLAGRRSVPAAALAFGPLTATAAAEFARRAFGAPGGDVTATAMAAAFALFLLAGACAFWTIPLFNRPRFLVPRPYRREDGLVAAHRRGRT